MHAFKKGSTFVFKDFIVKYAPSNIAWSRFGVSVGIKTSKKATVRNKIKRQLYETIRREFLKVLPRGDYIIVLRSGHYPLSPDLLKTSFEEAMQLTYEKLSG